MNIVKFKHKKTGELKNIKVTQTHEILEDQKYYGQKIHSVASATKKMLDAGFVRA